MASVFISHRKQDSVAARELARQIQGAGHAVWFDEWEITPGDSIVERIDQGLNAANYLILCYSASGSSAWVDREWMSTLARQLSSHDIRILPVVLSGGEPPAILADIKFMNLVADWDGGVRALLKRLG